MAVVTPDAVARFMPTDVLITNPHIGFTTFQRFNGDRLNPAASRRWTEGHQIEYQPDRGTRHNEDHPDTTVAYFRFYWKYFEPEMDHYNFAMLDRALETAASRGQTLMVRMAPHGTNEAEDTPAWYRKLSGEPSRGFMDYSLPTHPLFFERFTKAVRAIGERYDRDPRLDSVDMALYGQWGEGAGINELPEERRRMLVDAYTDAFRETPLMGLIIAPDLINYANRSRPVGFRAVCLGDMSDWHHMVDIYPRKIAEMPDVWKRAPVSFEVCWVVYHWLDMGWDIDYTIEQSLKWHISTFNAKSSPIPKEWEPNVNRWLKRMGYRYGLRFFDYPTKAAACDTLKVGFWMENRGVAPCYRKYPVALKLAGEHASYTLELNADIREWLPGDTLWSGTVTLPDAVPGYYRLLFAITDPMLSHPVITMPIDGETDEGWTVLGNIDITEAL
jgi:hypothetical protein